MKMEEVFWFWSERHLYAGFQRLEENIMTTPTSKSLFHGCNKTAFPIRTPAPDAVQKSPNDFYEHLPWQTSLLKRLLTQQSTALTKANILQIFGPRAVLTNSSVAVLDPLKLCTGCGHFCSSSFLLKLEARKRIWFTQKREKLTWWLEIQRATLTKQEIILLMCQQARPRSVTNIPTVTNFSSISLLWLFQFLWPRYHQITFNNR